LGKRSQLEADVGACGRLVIAENAYQQCVEHRLEEYGSFAELAEACEQWCADRCQPLQAQAAH
jgi:hypothetical protein